jgi:hypothetical protein
MNANGQGTPGIGSPPCLALDRSKLALSLAPDKHLMKE